MGDDAEAEQVRPAQVRRRLGGCFRVGILEGSYVRAKFGALPTEGTATAATKSPVKKKMASAEGRWRYIASAAAYNWVRGVTMCQCVTQTSPVNLTPAANPEPDTACVAAGLHHRVIRGARLLQPRCKLNELNRPLHAL